jgi:hypothetical protein
VVPVDMGCSFALQKIVSKWLKGNLYKSTELASAGITQASTRYSCIAKRKKKVQES